MPFRCLFFSLFLFIFGFCAEGLTQDIDSAMSIYAEQYDHENIHLHIDKSAYNKNETIWFKAYLLTGSRSTLTSKNLYIDWIDGNGRLMAHHVLPVFGSSAQGNFNIPGDYKFGKLHIRAYTGWMMNFDSSFFYNRDVYINQGSTRSPQDIRVTTLKFFPEGGDLVHKLNAQVAFLATDQFGEPITIKGKLRTGKGEFLDSIFVTHDGMGSFELTNPDSSSEYIVDWTDQSGKTGTTNLPPIKKTGAVLRTQPVGDKLRVFVQRSMHNMENYRKYYLLAHMNQKILFKAKINLENTQSALTDMNTKKFQTGILQITLFDTSWRPVAERIVFINNGNYEFKTDVNIIARGLGPRERNVIEIDVKDSSVANMSVAVTDEAILQDGNSIVSQFLLSSELRGKITNPSFYFANPVDSTKYLLDLVMLTHGWRRFNWEDVLAGKLPKIMHPKDTAYIEISGYVNGRRTENAGAGRKESITLILSDSRGRQIVPMELDEKGSFSRAGFVFYDTSQVFFRFQNKASPVKRNVEFGTNITEKARIAVRQTQYPLLAKSDPLKFDREDFMNSEQKRLEKLSEGTTLKEVTVRSNFKQKTRIDSLNDKYTSGPFSGTARFNGDILSDRTAYRYQNIFYYLQTFVPGLTVSTAPQHDKLIVPPPNELKPPGNLYEILLRGERPFIYLNENLSEIDVLATLSMSDVAYVRVFSSPFFGAWANGLGGAIAVYTKRGLDDLVKASDEPDYKMILTGYTKYKEYSGPDYSDSARSFAPDTRSTIYWNPYLITDSKNPKIRFEFYNNDISRKLRMAIEGINANGELIRIEKILE